MRPTPKTPVSPEEKAKYERLAARLLLVLSAICLIVGSFSLGMAVSLRGYTVHVIEQMSRDIDARYPGDPRIARLATTWSPTVEDVDYITSYAALRVNMLALEAATPAQRELAADRVEVYRAAVRNSFAKMMSAWKSEAPIGLVLVALGLLTLWKRRVVATDVAARMMVAENKRRRAKAAGGNL